MCCVSFVRMKVIWNGQLSDEFAMGRGIRQGDPLSPYLFVLCMERLSHLIDTSVEHGDWSPIRLSRNGPRISHLFFADDLFLFAEASVEQTDIIRNTLGVFCSLSGEKVSMEKTGIFCSPNINHNVKSQISQNAGFQLTGNLGKYLGTPLHHSRVNKTTYQFVIDKARKRMNTWKAKTLSLAGRATLIRSILSSLPIYYMQTAIIPSKICEDLDKVAREFLWGTCGNKRRPSLVAWEKYVPPPILEALVSSQLEE